MIRPMAIFKFIILFILAFNGPVYAYDIEDIKAQLKAERGEKASSRVIKIIDGDTVLLENNITVRLVGLQAPKIALGRKKFNEWPLGYQAKEALSTLALNQQVFLYYGGRKMDRYGRALAHLFLADGRWLQGEILKAGMARVYSFADNRSIVPQMLIEEEQARLNNIGIWDLDFYKIKQQQKSENHINSFQIIAGKIIDVARVGNIIFLNFGADYKTDFTIVIPGRVRRMFEKKGINPTEFEGKDIFVRGWLKYYNGPAIDLTHPEQLVIQ